jgi:hypothetical protein
MRTVHLLNCMTWKQTNLFKNGIKVFVLQYCVRWSILGLENFHVEKPAWKS